MSEEHRAIWLEPRCAAESGEDRHWCQDDTWGKCDECGTPSVKYIIATEHDALVKALKVARARIEYLGAACHDPRHFEENNTTFFPIVDAALAGVVGSNEVSQTVHRGSTKG